MMETNEITAEGVRNLVQGVWNSFLGLELSPVAGEPGGGPGGGHYTAWVRVIGSHNLIVVLRCSEGLARESAARMFGVEESQVGEDQVRDGLKELVNILGGNVKGMMAKYHFLSMPSASEPGKEPRLPQNEALFECGFAHRDRGLKLSVLKME